MPMNLLKTKGKNPQIREVETKYSKLQKLSAMAPRKSRDFFVGHMDNARQCTAGVSLAVFNFQKNVLTFFFSNSPCIGMAIR
jgi:hypothetical protein